MTIPTREELRRQWRGLSKPMKAALDAAADKPLYRRRHGWAKNGLRGHSPGTVEALAKRGLLKINRLSGCAGEAHITKLGSAVFGSVGEPVDWKEIS